MGKHDVFLSCRGDDTRPKFTDIFHSALTDAGINTYPGEFDHPSPPETTSERLRAIHESRICVILFSESYADSICCLDELSEIVECRKTLHHLLVPVFYDIDPSDIRKQSNSLAEAFARHEKRFASDSEKVAKWRAALTEAANLSGWDSRNFTKGHERKFIKKIVQQILNELKVSYTQVAIYPVGIDVRMKQLNSLMDVETENRTLVLGICGMSGIGKTTLSKAIFNQFFHCFEFKSFLANVRENSSSPNGLVLLQEQLLSDTLKTNKIRIRDVDIGVSKIKQKLCRKKVLVVLDDVDHIVQVNALARHGDWFGLGSRIIMTTANQQLLKVLRVDEVYPVGNNSLDENESLELFSWHAFLQPYPSEEFVEYSKDVVSCCGSLPLALEVLGSFLGSKEISEWRNEVEKLKRIPPGDFEKKLRLSFDGLNDEAERDMFLYVSGCLVGTKKEAAVKILDGYGFDGEVGLKVLISKCLLKIDSDDELTMHDLLRDMGRAIVKEESASKKPGKRFRPWLQEEQYDDHQEAENSAQEENVPLAAVVKPESEGDGKGSTFSYQDAPYHELQGRLSSGVRYFISILILFLAVIMGYQYVKV